MTETEITGNEDKTCQQDMKQSQTTISLISLYAQIKNSFTCIQQNETHFVVKKAFTKTLKRVHFPTNKCFFLKTKTNFNKVHTIQQLHRKYNTLMIYPNHVTMHKVVEHFQSSSKFVGHTVPLREVIPPPQQFKYS